MPPNETPLTFFLVVTVVSTHSLELALGVAQKALAADSRLQGTLLPGLSWCTIARRDLLSPNPREHIHHIGHEFFVQNSIGHIHALVRVTRISDTLWTLNGVIHNAEALQRASKLLETACVVPTAILMCPAVFTGLWAEETIMLLPPVALPLEPYVAYDFNSFLDQAKASTISLT